MARNRQYPLRGRPAFTLIELLLVVALISLLISMLLPALKFSRDSSQRSVCQGNLRLLLEGYQSYARENGRRLMGANTSNAHDWIGGGNTITSITNGTLWNHVRSMRSLPLPESGLSLVPQFLQHQRHAQRRTGQRWHRLQAALDRQHEGLGPDGLHGGG